MNLQSSVAMLVATLARAFTTTAVLASLISTWRALAPPYTVYYEKHKKPLTLCYDFPIETSRTVYCKVYDTKISKNGWAYYNKDSHFIAHIYCAFDHEEEDSILVI
ncbi:hypothetical protein ACSBR1_017666 [Camellia fascicularis]